MLRNGFNLGGEQSGHMIFRDYSSTGDGLVAALQLLRIMKAKDAPLSKLAQCWTRYPQLVTNVRVREKKPIEQLNGLNKLVAEAENDLKAQGGRLLLRYSTAPNRKRACCSRAATKPHSKPGAQKSWQSSKKKSASNPVADFRISANLTLDGVTGQSGSRKRDKVSPSPRGRGQG